jgi:probable rRNA maturation factor
MKIKPTMMLKLQVQYASEASGIPTRPQFRQWVNAALTQSVEITLRIVDEAEGRELNHQFRGKENATNVLTFVYNELEILSGDIVLCTAVIEKEAQQQQKPLKAHYAHLVIHGVLHLQGYAHIKVTDAATMEKLETKIVTALGFDDPYQTSTLEY